MKVQVAEMEGTYVIQAAGTPVRTPYGSAYGSRHRELAEALAAEIELEGADPTTSLGLVQLHASYLDYGSMVPRWELESSIQMIEPEDIFLQRPADPRLMLPLMSLWGLSELRGAAFAEALQSLTLRQLMTVMVAGAALHSAVLGIQVVTTDKPLVPLALGACGRHVSYLAGAGEAGAFAFGGLGNRHDPVRTDGSLCRRCCRPRKSKPKGFEDGCEVHHILATMRFYAGFPDD